MSATESTVIAATEPTTEGNLSDALSDEALDKIFADPADSPEDADTGDGAGDASPVKEGQTADDAARQLADGKTADTADEGINPELLKDEPEPEKPKDGEDPYLKTVREFLPNEQALRTVIGAYQRETAFQTAVQSGNIGAIYQALGPNAETVFELFYQSAKDKLVERYINEAQGNGPSPEVESLRQQLAAMQKFLETGVETQRRAAHTENQRKAMEAIVGAINRDLTTARVPDDEYRDILREAVIATLAQNGTLGKAMTGDLKPVRAAVKMHLDKLVAADKKRLEAVNQKRTQRANAPKPILDGGGGPTATVVAGDPTDRDSMLEKASAFIERNLRKGSR